jgi:hypothetical protein
VCSGVWWLPALIVQAYHVKRVQVRAYSMFVSICTYILFTYDGT